MITHIIKLERRNIYAKYNYDEDKKRGRQRER